MSYIGTKDGVEYWIPSKHHREARYTFTDIRRAKGDEIFLYVEMISPLKPLQDARKKSQESKEIKKTSKASPTTKKRSSTKKSPNRRKKTETELKEG